MFARLVSIELKLLYRRRQELLNPILFFLMVCTLFPLAISPESEQLRTLAPGIVWVAAMLASLLSLDMLFRHDFDDGTLEQMCFSRQPLYLLCIVKILCYWLMSGLPLVIIAPLLGMMLFLPAEAMMSLMLSLLVGTPILSLIGSVGAGLTVGLKKGGVVISLLVLPLFMPVLIFGSSAVVAATQGLPWSGQIAWLGAMLVVGIVIAPAFTATALRISISAD